MMMSCHYITKKYQCIRISTDESYVNLLSRKMIIDPVMLSYQEEEARHLNLVRAGLLRLDHEEKISSMLSCNHTRRKNQSIVRFGREEIIDAVML